MQDAFAYCAQSVRSADRDRFLAGLFAPAQRRSELYALYAFNAEIVRVPALVREPLPGEIRLQWWREVVNGERAEEAAANPVASAWLAVMARHRLDAAKLIDLIEAHRFDLYTEPMATIADLEAYAGRTSAAIIALAAQILAEADIAEIAAAAGKAQTIVAVLQALSVHAERRQLYLPRELLERHGVQATDIFGHRASAGVTAALADLRDLARRHLAAVAARMPALPLQALPALLPIALVRRSLNRLERSAPFAPAALPQWQRQWLIWRAARQPSRIAD